MTLPVPDPSTYAGEHYQRLLPAQLAAGGDPQDLILWCMAKGAMIQDLLDIARDDPATGRPGYADLMDIHTCPSGFLGWLAQFRGVTLDPSLDDASQRVRIQTTDGFKRGSPGAIIGAAQQYLTGAREVILRERYNPNVPGPDPWHFQVITYTSQTPNPQQVIAAVNAQKPAGTLMHLSVVAGEDWQSVKNNNATWNTVKTTYATWQGVANATPGS